MFPFCTTFNKGLGVILTNIPKPIQSIFETSSESRPTHPVPLKRVVSENLAKFCNWNWAFFGKALPMQFNSFYLMKRIGFKIALFAFRAMNNGNIFYNQQIFFFAITTGYMANFSTLCPTNITNHFIPHILLGNGARSTRRRDEEIPRLVPVVRQPGEAKTSDHMSSIGSR